MSNTKDIVLFESGMFMLKGENGSGKTAAAGAFHKHKTGKIYFFDIDGKMDTIKHMYPNADVEYDFYGLHNFDQLLVKLEGLQHNCPYDVVVLDSFTSLSMTIVNNSLNKKSSGGKAIQGVQVPTWDEINVETAMLGKMLDICKILSVHKKKIVIWTAHPISKTEIVGGATVRSRPITCYGNKIGSIAPSYFSEIYNFTVEKTSMKAGDPLTRVCYTQNQGEDFAKSALGLPPRMEWTGKNFYDLLSSNVKR